MSLTALALIALAALQAGTPEWHHAYLRERPDETHARYAHAAIVIGKVTLDAGPLEGLTREQTAALLATVLTKESAVRRDVMACERVGMGGAMGPYQVEAKRHRAEACGGIERATALAYTMLLVSWHVCDGMPMAERAAFYVGGNGFRTEQARHESRRRVLPALRIGVQEDQT